MKIVITDDRFGWIDEEKQIFEGDELFVANCHTEEDLIKACADADAILLNQAPMTRAVIQSLKKCRVISRYGTGYDNVDIEAATQAGIRVTNVPGYCSEEVAEHALGLLLSCVRAIPEKNRHIKNGGWNINRPIKRMSGRVLGIAGFGASGKAFWEKVQGFAFSRILITDPRGEAKLAAIRERDPQITGEIAPFDEMIRESDFISFHVPLNEITRHCINRETIAHMKDGVILINTSRGAVMDEAALAEALKQGKISWAGLDVFEKEPLPPDHPFLALPNVILTDHSAYYSVESVSDLKTRTAQNARDVLEGRVPRTAVNEL